MTINSLNLKAQMSKLHLKSKNFRYFIIPVIILFLISMSIYLLSSKKTPTSQTGDFETINYTLPASPAGGKPKTYTLLVADTPAQWEKGLMFFRKLDGVDGMIFIFPDSQYRTFWNKNTLMDLKLLWIQNDKQIGESFLPSIEKSKEIVTVSSPGLANKVIELPANP